MSLATDILKKAGVTELTPKQNVRKPNATFLELIERRRTRKYVRACGFQDNKAVNLGNFKTTKRAAIANRLFNYWKSLGYENIPTKPELRPYNRNMV